MFRTICFSVLLAAVFGQSQWCMPVTYQAEIAVAYGADQGDGIGNFVDGTYAVDFSGGRTRVYSATNEVPGFKPVYIVISDSKMNMTWQIQADAKGVPQSCKSVAGVVKTQRCLDKSNGWSGYYTQNVGGWNGKGGVKVQLLANKATDGSYTQLWVSKDASGAVIPVTYHYLNAPQKSLTGVEYSSGVPANMTLFTPPSICNKEYYEGMDVVDDNLHIAGVHHQL
eukprot:TRINITY_DN75506_c0_g1_i1.p1 TRINITY_DN75506_c0_g1~~TRINITY_DN75506_c0_g1_i1.p1  ORF type:complete len:225 (+),score=52.55 TRINITY_DN75506_c0_g1_i1:28-702(+)